MQPSELSVVGLGNGHLDQLTLSGLALIKGANVVVYDAQLDAEIRAFGSDQKHFPVHSGLQNGRPIEEECRHIADLIRRGSRVVRLSLDHDEHKKRLERELIVLRRLGIKKRFIPSMNALHNEAWNLRLPWLSEAMPGNFRVIPSTQVRGDRNFWRYLADEAQTLALDVGQGRLQGFIDRLLLAGADPERPVALVAHHPTQSPICWLTTLEEVDELWPQWQPNGATIVYIGTWPHAIRDTESNKSFWGSLEAAAEDWLRAQRA